MDQSKTMSLEDKLGVFDTAQNAERFNGHTFEGLLEYLAKNAFARNATLLDGVSLEELLNKIRDMDSRILDADRLNGLTVEDILTDVKNRIRELSHPYVMIPFSKGGWSRLVSIPENSTSTLGKKHAVNDDLLFAFVGGGPYGFMAERPVAYMRIGREGRAPVINVMSGRYTTEFFYRRVKIEDMIHTEIWCGDAARNDFQIVLLSGMRGCTFGSRERPVAEKPEGDLVPIRLEQLVHRSYADKVLANLRAEIDELKSEINATNL